MGVRKDLTSGLTAERLRELLDYDPATGVFTWRVKRSRVPAGDIAGSITWNGYREICIDGCLHYRAHRLAFLWMNGRWPKHDIDHRNFDRADNRWTNLREATSGQNKQNTRVRKDSWSGVKGVCLQNNGRGAFWRVAIEAEGKRYTRVCHGSLEEAATMRAKLARTYHGEFARAE